MYFGLNYIQSNYKSFKGFVCFDGYYIFMDAIIDILHDSSFYLYTGEKSLPTPEP